MSAFFIFFVLISFTYNLVFISTLLGEQFFILFFINI